MKSQKGFALIETLVALGIFGLVAVTSLSGMATVTQGNVIASERATAESLVRSEIEYVKQCAYQYDASEYPIDSTLTIPQGWSLAPPAVEPVHATDDGIQKITITAEHNGDAVLSVEIYKADR